VEGDGLFGERVTRELDRDRQVRIAEAGADGDRGQAGDVNGSARRGVGGLSPSGRRARCRARGSSTMPDETTGNKVK